MKQFFEVEIKVDAHSIQYGSLWDDNRFCIFCLPEEADTMAKLWADHVAKGRSWQHVSTQPVEAPAWRVYGISPAEAVQIYSEARQHEAEAIEALYRAKDIIRAMKLSALWYIEDSHGVQFPAVVGGHYIDWSDDGEDLIIKKVNQQP